MAECMDDVLYSARVEQEDEVTALESIFDKNFHTLDLVENNNELEDNIISFGLSLKVHVPHDKVLIEAVIPVEVREPFYSDSDSRSYNKDQKKGLEKVALKDWLKDRDGATEECVETEEGAVACGVSMQPFKKPGLSRLLSTKHWHIQSEVKELMPINLWCTFPPLYPSGIMPNFSLSCHWLNAQQLKELSQKLVSLWHQNAGLPIVFTWAEFLENDVWEFLCLTPHLILREEFQNDVHTEKSNFTIANKVPLEMALLAILEHDNEKEKTEFMKTSHTCEICLEEKDGHEFCFIDECKHYCCTECLRYHCEMHVESGTVMRLLCPNHECDVTIPPQILQEILEDEKYKRWERLLLSRTLDLMRDIFYCPRCNTAVVADEEETSRLAQCATCFYAFCTECQEPWHYGMLCTGEQEQEVPKKNKKENADDGIDDEEDEQIDDVRASRKARRSQFMSSKAFITAMKSKGWFRNCPSCRMVVEKIHGCNFMTCSQCCQNFCWACGKAITSYSHFSSSPECSTIIIPVTEPQRPPPGPTEGEILIQKFQKQNPGKPVRKKKCISCHQNNLKLQNNNHIKCWACKTNFCYQCGHRIEGGFKHFVVPGTCVQHSDD